MLEEVEARHDWMVTKAEALQALNCNEVRHDTTVVTRKKLTLLEMSLELGPIVHDSIGLAVLGEGLSHLLHLLLAILDTIHTNVADKRNTSTHGSSGTRTRILDSDTLLRLDTQLLTSEEVDLGIWLGGRRVERGGGRVDLLIREELVHTNFVKGGNDTRLS